MADEQQYTTVHLKDGRTVHLKGQVAPDQIQDRLQAFQGDQPTATPIEAGHIAAHRPDLMERLENAIPSLGHAADIIRGRVSPMASMQPQDAGQLVYPERFLSSAQREAHPIFTATAEFEGALTSPDNLLLMKGLGALGLLGPRLGTILPRIASGVFAGQMGKASYQTGAAAHQNWQQYKQTGDPRFYNEALRLGTHSILNAVMTAFAGTHAAKGETLAEQPAPKAEEAPIAATGKTEAEVQAAKTPSIQDRLAELKVQLEAARQRELAKQPQPPTPPKQETVVPPQAVAPPQEVAKPQAPEAIASKQPSVQERLNKIKEQTGLYWDIYDKTWKPLEEAKRPLPAEGALPERKGPDWVQPSKLEAKQMAMRQRQQAEAAQGEETQDLLAKTRASREKELQDLREQSETTPRLATPPEASRPEAKPVQAPETKSRRGEPVRPAEVATLGDVRQRLVDSLVKEHNLAKEDANGLADKIMSDPKAAESVLSSGKSSETVKTLVQLGQLMAKRAETEPRSLRGDLGERPPAQPRVSPEDFKARMELQRQMVESMQADPKYKGVSKTELQRIASEKIRSQRGAFGGGGPEDIRGRREAKIQRWLDTLRDPKAHPKAIDDAYKMLQAYGLSHDDIIQRMAGGAEFAKTPEKLEQYTGSDREQAPAAYWAERADLGFRIKALLRRGDIPGQDERLIDEMDVLDRFRDHLKTEEGKALAEQWALASPDEKARMAVSYWRDRGTLLDLPPREQRGSERGFLIQNLMQNVDDVLKKYPDFKAGALPGFSGQEIKDWALEESARIEGGRTGPDVEGVKGADLEELERIASKPDTRQPMPKAQPDSIFRWEDERGFWRMLPAKAARQAAPSPGVRGRLAEGLDRLSDLFEKRGLTDEEFKNKLKAENIIRGAASEKRLLQGQTYEVLKGAIERHDDPINQRQNFVDFHNAGEHKEGTKFLNPEDQAIADWLRSEFSKTAEGTRELKGEEWGAIDNYFGRLWKQDKALDRFMSLILRKRPLEGGKGFLRKRYYEFASDAVDHGLVPIDWNPIRTQLAALAEQQTFLFAHDVKNMFKDAGIAQYFKVSEYKNIPEGWTPLNDKIFKPRVMEEGGLKEYGTYYAPREVAEVFNNYLSPGLGSKAVFRTLRNYGNNLNMANLGLSAYHGTFISLVAQASDLALGMQKVWNYKNVEGWRDIMRGSIGTLLFRSATRDYNFGKELQEQALSPGTHPELQHFVDALVKGGARFKPDAEYFSELSQRKGFENWLKLALKGKLGEMASIGIRTAAKPIMEKYVPAVKLAMGARMAEAKLADLKARGIEDPDSIATEMGKIWDSVDNRAGQMVYDNIFVNRAIKDLSFVAIRAVGWDLGSIREFGGAGMIDLPRQTAKLLRGQRPELTHRLAFTIATVVSTGLLGGIMHYYLTGQVPRRTEDYFFPGPEGAKVSIPSYIKDFYSFKHDWMGTILNKLAPQWSQINEFYHNADFYGTEIRHPGDDVFKQGWDFLKWYGKTALPYGAVGIQKRIERGERPWDAASSFFGFMPAPSWVERTKASELANTLAMREWSRGPRTAGDYERHQLVQKYRHQLAAKSLDQKEVLQAYRARKLQTSDIDAIYDSPQESQFLHDFRGLSLMDGLAVMRDATPSERVQLKPYLADKLNDLSKYPEDQQRALENQVRNYLQQ